MQKRIALALSSGGARGLAHIGVIDELNRRGYEIVSMAGSSMGALVAGMYAAGTLPGYKKWVQSLSRMDVLSLVDFTIGAKGFVKGEKIFDEMHRLGFIPDINIEDLPIPITILATDIINNQEVIFKSGNLGKALRASVSIPNVFTPIETNNSIWVDGGVLNPLPLKHLDVSRCDHTIAVDINALIPYSKPRSVKEVKRETEEEKSIFDQMRERWYEFFEGDSKHKLSKKSKLGYFDLMYRVVQVMLNKITQEAIKETPPDILVQISKDACGIFEFYKAKEIIELGAKTCAKALDAKTL